MRDADVLTRRRRLLAGASLPFNSDSLGGVTLPDALAVPGGASAGGGGQSYGQSPRAGAVSTRARVGGGSSEYPSLASAGVLVPIPLNH